MEEVKFFKTPAGNVLAGLVIKGDDENLKELKAGATDGAFEKHVPAVKLENGKVIVDVGSIEHPMLDVHHIEFIALKSERGLEIAYLKPGEKPHAEFIGVEHGIVYEYCNLHGLWKAEF